MSAYTPGPWRLHAWDTSAFSHLISSGNGSGDVALIYRRGKQGDNNSNARLIAAAPDLLEALIVAEDFVNSHSEEWYGSGQRLLAQIRAAIAKATQPMTTTTCPDCKGEGFIDDTECPRIRCIAGQIDDLPESVTKAYADTIKTMRPMAPEVMP